MDASSPDLLRSKRFITHSVYLLEMIDTALNMLGPDIELLTEIMMDLGKKHIRYGVTPEMFPAMRDALVATLTDSLGDDFTAAAREAWIETYKELSGDMIRGITTK